MLGMMSLTDHKVFKSIRFEAWVGFGNPHSESRTSAVKNLLSRIREKNKLYFLTPLAYCAFYPALKTIVCKGVYCFELCADTLLYLISAYL